MLFIVNWRALVGKTVFGQLIKNCQNLSILNCTLFTNSLSCGGVRRYCTVRKLPALPHRRHLRLCLLLPNSNALPILRDKMVGDVVCRLDRIVLRYKRIPSYSITPTGGRLTETYLSSMDVFDLFSWSGWRCFR